MVIGAVSCTFPLVKGHVSYPRGLLLVAPCFVAAAAPPAATDAVNATPVDTAATAATATFHLPPTRRFT
jgi:hypothetical protein